MTKSASAVRQRFADLDSMIMDNDDDDENEHVECKPLKPSLRTIQRTVVFHVSKRSKNSLHRKRDEYITCFGYIWRILASMGLLIMLITPFLYSLYLHSQRQYSREKIRIPDYPSDHLQCAKDYNISFAKLHRQIASETAFCKEYANNNDVPHDTNIHIRQIIECTCSDPLEPTRHVPTTPQYFEKWDRAHQRNRNIASQQKQPQQQDGVSAAKVVFYGDSIIEHLSGTDLGDPTQEAMSVQKQFQEIFDDGSAVALGLAGDRCPQLLYRLQHGELPNTLDPMVIWLLIGTNDQADHCSKGSILMGIINIVLFLQEQRPDAYLVINGILPKPNPSSRKWRGTMYYDSVTWINQRLECFAQGEDTIEYFDPAIVFIDDQEHVPTELLPDGLHPSALGAKLWAEAMKARVDEIMN